MKINNENTTQAERLDEPADKKGTKKSEDKKDFKELLKGKGGEKGKKAPKGSQKKTVGDRAARQASEQRTATGQPGKQTLGQADGFSRRLKGGELQLGRQLEQKDRLGAERQVTQHHDEARVEHGHRKKHHRQVHTEHAQKARRGQDVRAPKQDGGPRQNSGPKLGAASSKSHDASRAEQSVELQPAQVGTSEAKGPAKAKGNAPIEQSKLRAEVAELAKQLVERAHVGRDASGRQIMLLDLQVPGRGNVRVRLRRRGDGFELRMRPENEDFARDLRREREHFRQSAADKGVDFTSIEIV
ncbi:flagellar hook-length control protein FliK [Persicimonas caeni]|uniref:Flagellar hook-length control protein FliK n=1 Tax=Persicimonas caeni TaxID=2292766 RepID=A0A4Y6PTE1_PERCE|nr:flagellar hook-length control protein FliK [Persicimonas caeni]QDG51520.1 flagellar hook-length control protein FliK [Persicimonas caeni]QED32741.1 flagellar hook-length control protein FliK [Persicimonas caeni]